MEMYELFTEEVRRQVTSPKGASEIMKALFDSYKNESIPIYLLVDEGNSFWVMTERETTAGRGYVDLEIYICPGNPFKHAQHAFEVKYIKEGEEETFEQVKEMGKIQLQSYLQTDTTLKSKQDLQAYVVVFVKDSLYWEKVN